MTLTIVTEPSSEPVTIAEVRQHLRLDTSAGEVAPTAPTVALAGDGAGNVDDGVHRYRVTFVTADGETEGGTISDAVTVADKTSDGKVAVSAIPLGGSAVTSRKLYRTEADGSDYKLLTTIDDNTTTTYTDNTADSGLGAGCPTTNTTEDPKLNALIKTARHKAEELTERALITQTWDWFLDKFPSGNLEVPKPPLDSVTHVKYYDTSGDLQTWDSGDYDVDTDSAPGRISPAYGESYPTARLINNAVNVRFVAGYGDADDVPQPIKEGILELVAFLYANRGASDDEIPRYIKEMFWRYSRVTF